MGGKAGATGRLSTLKHFKKTYDDRDHRRHPHQHYHHERGQWLTKTRREMSKIFCKIPESTTSFLEWSKF